MFVYAIYDCMLFEGAFCALRRSCNLQGISELDSVNVARLVPWTLSCLGLSKRAGVRNTLKLKGILLVTKELEPDI